MKIVLATLHTGRSPQSVPLAAACLAAALPEELRRDVRILDLFPELTLEAMRLQILAASPDFVAFPLYVWNRPSIVELARQLKAERPDLYLLAGGPEAGADPEGLLSAAPFDALVRGEGEGTFREVVERLCRGEDPEGVPGLTVRTASGFCAGPDRGAEDDPPSPWLTGVLTPLPGGGVLWETSRGCTFGCDYCYDARGARGVRHFPTGRLEAELDLFARARIGQMWVLDSTFNFPPERGRELLHLLARKLPDVHVHLEAKAEFLDQATVRLLGRRPCSVQLGLQSARPEILGRLHRQLDIDLFASKVRLLHAEGVTYGFDLIYGLPGDDYAGFCGSLNAALALGPNHVELFPLAVLPGTPLHRRRDELGLRAMEVPPYHVLESSTCPAAELERCRRLAAAADLFYNVGRAVAFFPALLRGVELETVPFLEEFAVWSLGSAAVPPERFHSPGSWRPAEVLDLQERFVTELLRRKGRSALVPAALDLMRFHYHYAETLMGEEALPAQGLQDRNPWTTPWRTSPAVRLVSFSYEILDLQEMVEPDLEAVTAMFRPVGSTAVFLRRGEEVICESLEDDFLRLLRESDGRRSPRDIFGGTLPSEQGTEIVEFALAEGFLLPAISEEGP